MATARMAVRAANLGLEEAVADAEARYVAARPKSRAIFEQNLKAMPGGNTRTVLFFRPFPTVIAREAKGRGWSTSTATTMSTGSANIRPASTATATP